MKSPIGCPICMVVVNRAAGTLPGPIYVHCHHGKHRGPTAAAVLYMANDGWDASQAQSWLVAAGTATNYTGLYDVVRAFCKPTDERLIRTQLDQTFDAMAKTCSSCHKAHRDPAGIKAGNEPVTK